MTFVFCPDEPRIAAYAGPDVMNLWAGRSVVPGGKGDRLTTTAELVDPGWGGFGWDQGVTWQLPSCVRAGVREQVISHNVAFLDRERFGGSEWQLVTEATLGAELTLPLGFAVGAHVLPGVRAAVSTQRVDLPERDLDLRYRSVSFVPVLYAGAAVRWWARPWIGAHVDVQLPVANFVREQQWFPNRYLGAGLDVSVPRD